MPERGYSATKDQLDTRLSRIEGQVRGIRGMVAEDRYCIDVLTQINAIQAALDKVALGLLDGHVSARRAKAPGHRGVEAVGANGVDSPVVMEDLDLAGPRGHLNDAGETLRLGGRQGGRQREGRPPPGGRRE